MRNPDTAWIPIRHWYSYAQRIERRNLRQYGTSLSATTIVRWASASIVEIQTERMLVYSDWRQVMQRAGKEEHP
jgi:hypothetical protein